MQSVPSSSHESRLLAVARRQIRFQRLALTLLLPATLVCLGVARVEKSRADRAQSDLTISRRLKTADLTISRRLKTADLAIIRNLNTPYVWQPSTHLAADTTAYYPAALVAEDGTETPLVGKALRVNLGREKSFEILLNKNDRNLLYMWAPAKQEDNYFNRVVLRPSCANGYQLGLERVELKRDSGAAGADSSDAVMYAAPH